MLPRSVVENFWCHKECMTRNPRLPAVAVLSGAEIQEWKDSLQRNEIRRRQLYVTLRSRQSTAICEADGAGLFHICSH